MDLKL